jgi:hypothetical protein
MQDNDKRVDEFYKSLEAVGSMINYGSAVYRFRGTSLGYGLVRFGHRAGLCWCVTDRNKNMVYDGEITYGDLEDLISSLPEDEIMQVALKMDAIEFFKTSYLIHNISELRKNE